MNIGKLIIAGIESDVLRYSEEKDEETGAMIINCVIKSNESDRGKMADAIGDNKYFDVIRPEIDNAPLIMRFGRKLWSEHDGYIKRNLVLVEKGYDNASAFSGLSMLTQNDCSVDNLVLEMSKYIAYSKALENLLLKKGIITEAELELIKKETESNCLDELKRFSIVDDAEKYR